MFVATRYILREQIGPFVFAFAVITFVLVMDFILEVINLVVAKGLSVWTVLELFALNLAWMLALSVPMAVLVATLMAFGRLGADHEVTAFKACGVNPVRLLLPVLAAATVLAGLMVFFNNQVLPEANHRARLLLAAISQKRPTLRIEPNVFIDDVPGYHFIVKKVDPRSGKISGVTIYDQKERPYPRTIIAKRGEIAFAADGTTLVFTLYDGEVHEADENDPTKYRRVAFDKQTVYMREAGSQLIRQESDYRTDREMSAAEMQAKNRQTRANLDGLQKQLRTAAAQRVSQLLTGNPLSGGTPSAPPDSAVTARAAVEEQAFALRLQEPASLVTSFQQEINSLAVEIHKKYAIPVACVVFALIGAPLGILVRRGGFGTSAGISLGFFIFYWACLIGGEELADRRFISAFWAMWTANLVLGLAGLWLLFLTQRDRGFPARELLAKPGRFLGRALRRPRPALP